MTGKLFIFIASAIFLQLACTPSKHTSSSSLHTNQQIFWKALNSLCGQSFAGTVISAPANDTVFKNKLLIMHVRSCNDTVIRVPFIVGDDRSRTWVLSITKNTIQLKHDHRHKDGTPDAITMYGGVSSSSGSATMQMFPADESTANILPAAAMNVWWVELVSGSHFTYNLRRIGTDRLFTIRFDLKQTVPNPEVPWGW